MRKGGSTAQHGEGADRPPTKREVEISVKRALLWVLVVGLCASGAWAQEIRTAKTLEVGGRQAGDHLLRVDDVLEFHVYALPELEKEFKVRVDGRFFHPVIGDVSAAGRTIDDLRAEVAKRLAKELRNPTFRLGVKEYAVSEVSVLGEVEKQGTYKVKKGTTMLELLAQAGGLNEKADRDEATILRNGERLGVSLHPGQEPVLIHPGDILYVNTGLRISVQGEVNKPGVYAVSRTVQNPVGEALKRAGGAKHTAALNRVKLFRPTLTEPRIVQAIPKPDEEFVAEVLQDGDSLFIPPRQAVVTGAASKPVPLSGGETILEVVSAAGVSEDSAKLHEVSLIRYADMKAGNTDKREVYDVEKMLKGEKDDESPEEPVYVHDGDLIYIPAKNKGGGFLNNRFVNMLMWTRFLF